MYRSYPACSITDIFRFSGARLKRRKAGWREGECYGGDIERVCKLDAPIFLDDMRNHRVLSTAGFSVNKQGNCTCPLVNVATCLKGGGRILLQPLRVRGWVLLRHVVQVLQVRQREARHCACPVWFASKFRRQIRVLPVISAGGQEQLIDVLLGEVKQM